MSLLKKGGGWIDLWLFAAPVQDSSGQTIGTIKIFSDLSERKRIEEERKKLAGVQNMEEPFWVRYITPPKNSKKNTKKQLNINNETQMISLTAEKPDDSIDN